jgi:hypothetical protein
VLLSLCAKFVIVPHSVVPRNKEVSKSVVIKVIKGNLSVAQIQAEMERLVLGEGKWVVEELSPNTFKTAFPSRREL